MNFARAIRPVIDRVYTGVRSRGRAHLLSVYADLGLAPGFESSFYFGLLARPMPAAVLADALIYVDDPDMTPELSQGVATVDADGAWRLTGPGRETAEAVQQAVGTSAAQVWASAPRVSRLADLVGTLIEHGMASGGPVFRTMAPPYEPLAASPAVLLTTRLGALRHHRADAHRAAWRAAGLTAAGIRDLPDGPLRCRIEEETDQRDYPIYQALTDAERLELLAGLGALPG